MIDRNSETQGGGDWFDPVDCSTLGQPADCTGAWSGDVWYGRETIWFNVLPEEGAELAAVSCRSGDVVLDADILVFGTITPTQLPAREKVSVSVDFPPDDDRLIITVAPFADFSVKLVNGETRRLWSVKSASKASVPPMPL